MLAIIVVGVVTCNSVRKLRQELLDLKLVPNIFMVKGGHFWDQFWEYNHGTSAKMKEVETFGLEINMACFCIN